MFTDSYGEQSYRGRSSFITGQSVMRTDLWASRVP